MKYFMNFTLDEFENMTLFELEMYVKNWEKQKDNEEKAEKKKR